MSSKIDRPSIFDPNGFAAVINSDDGRVRSYGPFRTSESAESFASAKQADLTKRAGSMWTGGIMDIGSFSEAFPGVIQDGLLNDPYSAGVSF